MLAGGAEEYAESAPWIAVFPGLAISYAMLVAMLPHAPSNARPVMRSPTWA